MVMWELGLVTGIGLSLVVTTGMYSWLLWRSTRNCGGPIRDGH